MTIIHSGRTSVQELKNICGGLWTVYCLFRAAVDTCTSTLSWRLAVLSNQLVYQG